MGQSSRWQDEGTAMTAPGLAPLGRNGSSSNYPFACLLPVPRNAWFPGRPGPQGTHFSSKAASLGICQYPLPPRQFSGESGPGRGNRPPHPLWLVFLHLPSQACWVPTSAPFPGSRQTLGRSRGSGEARTTSPLFLWTPPSGVPGLPGGLGVGFPPWWEDEGMRSGGERTASKWSRGWRAEGKAGALGCALKGCRAAVLATIRWALAVSPQQACDAAPQWHTGTEAGGLWS